MGRLAFYGRGKKNDGMFCICCAIKITVAQTINKVSDLSRLQEMERSGYLEFVSHSFTPLNMQDQDIPIGVLRYEILESKQYMEQHFNTHQLVFVPPNNQLSDKA